MIEIREIKPFPPSASSTADAMTAPTAATPPSPAPFIPSGLQVLRASSVIRTSTSGTSLAVGIEYVSEGNRKRLASVIILKLLEQCTAQPLSKPPDKLTAPSIGLIAQSDIERDQHLFDVDGARSGIDVYPRNLHAVRIGHVRGSEPAFLGEARITIAAGR